jgi:hypothetical protein
MEVNGSQFHAPAASLPEKERPTAGTLVNMVLNIRDLSKEHAPSSSVLVERSLIRTTCSRTAHASVFSFHGKFDDYRMKYLTQITCHFNTIENVT